MDEITNGHLKRYLDTNLRFAKTVVIKLEEAAALINEGLVATYGKDVVDTTDPTTWKYYLNLAGQYHPTDVRMSVVSFDTLDTIEFTKENLEVHTATATAYAYGTRNYHALVKQFPLQETLINGILCPVDLIQAIDATNGTILGYPAGLIEPNETTLVQELEEYIKRVFMRWYNVQFAMSDNLFVATFFTVLSTLLYPKVLNLRQLRCKTSEAHSFHIRMYLASHGELDRYLPYLTLKQALWLYRNINYLERNAGKASQFALLIQHLLTERGIPIGEYSIRQLDDFTDGYRAVQTARIKLLNADANRFTKETQEIVSIFNKELPEAEGNTSFVNANMAGYLSDLQAADSSVIQTKALISSMVDYTGSVPEPFAIVSLRQWCYLAFHDMYPVSISFQDPKTSETRTLFAKDAFFYLQYVLLSAAGLQLTTVPQYLNMQQRIHPRPSVEDLLSVTDRDYQDLRPIAELILSRQPRITPCYSVSSFFDHATLITDEAYWHWFLISSQQDYYIRAQVDNMIRRLYEDVRMEMTLSTTEVQTWLTQNNLPVFDLTTADSEQLAKTIFEAGTGLASDDTRLIKNIQKAMVDLVTELSSYSIQILREVNVDEVIPVNWPAVRLGNIRARQDDHRILETGTLILGQKEHAAAHEAIEHGVELIAHTRPSRINDAVHYSVDVNSSLTAQLRLNTGAADYAPAQMMNITYTGQNEVEDNAATLPGYTTFLKLPESHRQLLKSKY